MLSLPIMIAVAAGCSVLLIVGAVVGMVVWWRMRKDRLSLAMAQARMSRNMHGTGFNNYAVDSPIESPLPTYGALPYGVTHEWAPLGSQETFQVPVSQGKASKAPSPPPQRKEKSRSIRRSISKSLSKRLSLGRHRQAPIPLSPLIISDDHTSSTTHLPDAREKEPTSAVEGYSELPTEITPRNTPERDREDFVQLEMLNRRSGSTAWPLLPSDRISSVVGGQPALFDQQVSRLRNGSVTAQTAGMAPDMPVPQPPVSFNRSYQYPRDDSLMRLSSLSLETANSSILDDGMRMSMSVDGEFNSPSLPPCPTFTPFSPYDIVIGGSVARDCASQRRSQSQRYSSSTARLTFASSDSYRRESGGFSPRRSLTTKESPQPDWIAQLPRRSETVLSPSGSKTSLSHPSSRPVSVASGSSPRAHYARQSHRQQRYSMYETRPAKEDPLQTTPGKGRALDDRPKSVQMQSPGRMRESPLRPPLPSAMKSANGMRKGHRRQNCVRISIHPPITFGGPAFSPMLEEPEDVAESENDVSRRATQQGHRLETSQGDIRDSLTSRGRRTSKHGRHRSTGSIQEEPNALGNSLGTNSRIPRSNPSRKRSHSRTTSVDDVFMSENQNNGPPRIFSPPPPEEGHNLCRTPSPEKRELMWSLPPSNGFSNSSPKFPANASTGSPRRSAVKGPRNQPDRQSGNYTASANNSPSAPASATVSSPTFTFSAGGPGGTISSSSQAFTRSSTHLAASPTKDVRKSITLLRRMNSDAWDDDSRQYRRMGRSSSLATFKEQNYTTPPASNRNSVVSNGSVTIWEDATEDNTSTPPPARRRKAFTVLERIDSEGIEENMHVPGINHTDTVNRQSIIRAVPPSSSIGGMPDQDRNGSTDSIEEVVQRYSKNVSATATPNNKSAGLGLFGGGSTAPTPGSLYDRDGFLKE